MDIEKSPLAFLILRTMKTLRLLKKEGTMGQVALFWGQVIVDHLNLFIIQQKEELYSPTLEIRPMPQRWEARMIEVCLKRWHRRWSPMSQRSDCSIVETMEWFVEGISSNYQITVMISSNLILCWNCKGARSRASMRSM